MKKILLEALKNYDPVTFKRLVLSLPNLGLTGNGSKSNLLSAIDNNKSIECLKALVIGLNRAYTELPTIKPIIDSLTKGDVVFSYTLRHYFVLLKNLEDKGWLCIMLSSKKQYAIEKVEGRELYYTSTISIRKCKVSDLTWSISDVEQLDRVYTRFKNIYLGL